MEVIKALVAVGWLGFFIYLITKRKAGVTGIDRRWLLALFALKLAAGCLLWLVYTQHYPFRHTSDSFRYFDDAMIINRYLFEDLGVWFRFLLGIDVHASDLEHVHAQLGSWQGSYNYGIANDSPTIIRINMIIGLVSANGYATHIVFMCAIALIGHLLLAKGITDMVRPGASTLPVLVGSMIFPTVVFWGSGVLKEVPLIFGLGLLFYGLSGVALRSLKRFGFTLIALLVLGVTKPYTIISFAPAMVGLIVCLWFNRRPILTYLLVMVTSYFVAVNASTVYPPGDLLYILNKKQTDFYNVAHLNDAGSTVTISPVSSNAFSFLMSVPERLALTYLRPYPNEAQGWLQYAATLENVLFVMVLIAVFRLTAGMVSEQRRRYLTLFGAWVVFALWFGAIAGSTVPVLGAIVRYKLPVLFIFGGVAGALAPQAWTSLSTFKSNRGHRSHEP